MIEMASATAVEIFRHNVLSLMEDRGITQGTLSKAVGMSRPGLNRVLAGKEGLSMERAERIAGYFGFPLAALIADKFVLQAS